MGVELLGVSPVVFEVYEFDECNLANYLAKTVDACRVGFLGVLSVAVEGGKGNEPQERVLEKNGRFGQ